MTNSVHRRLVRFTNGCSGLWWGLAMWLQLATVFTAAETLLGMVATQCVLAPMEPVGRGR